MTGGLLCPNLSHSVHLHLPPGTRDPIGLLGLRGRARTLQIGLTAGEPLLFKGEDFARTDVRRAGA